MIVRINTNAVTVAASATTTIGTYTPDPLKTEQIIAGVRVMFNVTTGGVNAGGGDLTVRLLTGWYTAGDSGTASVLNFEGTDSLGSPRYTFTLSGTGTPVGRYTFGTALTAFPLGGQALRVVGVCGAATTAMQISDCYLDIKFERNGF